MVQQFICWLYAVFFFVFILFIVKCLIILWKGINYLVHLHEIETMDKFQIDRGKTASAARNWTNFALQADATTFALPSVSILFYGYLCRRSVVGSVWARGALPSVSWRRWWAHAVATTQSGTTTRGSGPAGTQVHYYNYKYSTCTVRRICCMYSNWWRHCKALCDVEFSQIEGKCRKFRHVELSNSVIS